MENDSKVAAKLAGEGVKEIIIREGDAPVIHEEEKVEIAGNIKAPGDFFENRKDDLKQNHCHVIFNRNTGVITLQADESNYFGANIKGSLLINPDIDSLAINKQKTFVIKDLQQNLKMNRMLFVDSDKHAVILADLTKLKVSIQTQLEQEQSNSGSSRNSVDVKVDSQLNTKFTLEMPVYIGFPKKKFEVEICVNVRDKAVELWLESVELAEIMASEKNAIIDNEIKRFDQVLCIEE